MHFAVGMGCAGAASGLACTLLRRGWRWIPAAMTVGGVWALVPDLPRIFREDIYLPRLSEVLGNHDLERSLHAWGDWFFFHRQLDMQPHEFALLGLALVLLLYNVCILLLMRLERKSRLRWVNEVRMNDQHRKFQEVQYDRRKPLSIHGYEDDPTATMQLEEADTAAIYKIRPEDPLHHSENPHL